MHCTSYQVLGSDLPEPRLVSTHRGSQDAASDCNSPSPTYWQYHTSQDPSGARRKTLLSDLLDATALVLFLRVSSSSFSSSFSPVVIWSGLCRALNRSLFVSEVFWVFCSNCCWSRFQRALSSSAGLIACLAAVTSWLAPFPLWSRLCERGLSFLLLQALGIVSKAQEQNSESRIRKQKG